MKEGRYWIVLNGAIKTEDGYKPREQKVAINMDRISAVYDHTVLVDGYQIRVLETCDEIISGMKEIMR